MTTTLLIYIPAEMSNWRELSLLTQRSRLTDRTVLQKRTLQKRDSPVPTRRLLVEKKRASKIEATSRNEK